METNRNCAPKSPFNLPGSSPSAPCSSECSGRALPARLTTEDQLQENVNHRNTKPIPILNFEPYLQLVSVSDNMYDITLFKNLRSLVFLSMNISYSNIS